jgi:Leucine-rich repeat (LRR) protein
VKAVFVEDRVITFEDPNLEQAVREAIEKQEGELMTSDVIHLSFLNAGERGITSLVGIGNLKHLRTLQVWSNQIADILPLVNLEYLFELGLSENPVSDITPLTSMNQLKNLWLDDCPNLTVAEIQELANMTWLELLGIGDMNLTTEDVQFVQNLTNLWGLRVSSNNIEDFTFVTNLPNLRDLYIGRNPGDYSVLGSMTYLETLWLTYTDLTTEEVSFIVNYSNVSELWLQNNKIDDISFLVNNESIGQGDNIRIENNLLDLTPGSKDMTNIQTLIDRGVNVVYEAQN